MFPKKPVKLEAFARREFNRTLLYRMMKLLFFISLTLWSTSAVMGQEILSDPGTLGPALEVIHLFYDQWPTGQFLCNI